MQNIKSFVRLIAFYLPQFHPIPENDRWWGKGFTEWTNVVKAKPLFRGHYQPHLPADLGFYDLRVPETRAAQAEMAAEHGIEGFCYWHYWFGGKQLLETPFNDVLKLKEPKFPFCLAWANVPWTGVWGGSSETVLIDQQYPGIKDHALHFNYLIKAFFDERYITVDGNPIMYIHHPTLIPDARRVTDFWRELALKSGLKGLHLIGGNINSEIADKLGFDSYSHHFPKWRDAEVDPKYQNKIINYLYKSYRRELKIPEIFSYSKVVESFVDNYSDNINHFPLIIPNWDNTPRMGYRGVVFHNSTKEKFRHHVRKVYDQVINKPEENRIIFAKSWNEWAEGNHLEPDQKYGKAYLEILKEELIHDTRGISVRSDG